MTFTYTPSQPDDTTRVRFHLRDTAQEARIFSDEEIACAISEEGSWQAAVLALATYLIALRLCAHLHRRERL